MKILIADDNKRIREIIKKILAQHFPSCEFFEAENGNQAVSLTQLNLPDFILLDLVMPEKDGIVALNEILSLRPFAKIIIVTQLPVEDYKNELINKGAAEFVNKENLSSIPNVLNELLNKTN